MYFLILIIFQSRLFEEKAFYTWGFPLPSKSHTILLIVVVSIVLGLVLFPVWPLQVKIGMWYVSVILILLIIGLIIVRYLAYILMWILGCEFWLFPNLFDDEKGVVDSFIPAITFQTREGDSFATKFARIACLGLLIYVGYSIIKEPKMISSFSDASYKGVADLLNWGQLKLAGNATDDDEAPPPNPRKTLEEIEKELNEEGNSTNKNTTNSEKTGENQQNEYDEYANDNNDDYNKDDKV